MHPPSTTCPRCGATVSPGRFCSECAAPLAAAPPTTTLPPPPDVESAPTNEDAPAGDLTEAASTVSLTKLLVLCGLGLALIGGAVAIVLSLRGSDESHTVEGTFTLIDLEEFEYLDEGDHCSGSGGYSDVSFGAQVKVRDGEGKSLATATLKGGTYEGLGFCEFTWSTEVPDADFYRFEMGRRGEIEYTRDEMEENDWQVDLSLGSVLD